ncbi:hypothetical protein ACLB2K_026547 [Fragaria x ananassa]
MATMAASQASLTASLISKLYLSQQEEPVDLGDLQYLKNGFFAPWYYLVGHHNTARAVAFDVFRSAVRNMWRLSSPVKVQQRVDRYMFTFTNERDVKRVAQW